MLTQSLAASYGTMGAGELAGYDVGEAATLEILEGLGHLYGAMGYTMDDGGDLGGAEDGLNDDPDLDDFGDDFGEGLGITPWQQRMKFFERRGARGRISPAKALKKLIKAKKAKGKVKHEGLLRHAPKWLVARYGRSNEKARKGLRAAGLNVPGRCPDGSNIWLAGTNRDRWLCFNQPGQEECDKAYFVWHRKSKLTRGDFPGRRHRGGRWHCRPLKCPGGTAISGKRRRDVPCKKDEGWFSKVTGAVSEGVKAAADVIKKAVLAPIDIIKGLAIKVLMMAVLPLAGKMCKVPENILKGGALAAGQDPDMFIEKFRLFCKAVKMRKFSDIRKFLPDVIQIAVKVAASAAVPGLGPALAVIRRIPGLKIPGLSGTLGDAGAMLGTPGADPVELIDSMSHAEIAWALNGLSNAELAAGLDISPKLGKALGLGVGVAALGTGLFFVFRNR